MLIMKNPAIPHPGTPCLGFYYIAKWINPILQHYMKIIKGSLVQTGSLFQNGINK